MKRAYRLRRPDQFLRVRRTGRKWDAAFISLSVSQNRRRQSRCGFVVGKRIGKAVVRNRVRRRLREAVRLMYNHIAPGWDLVFIARSPELTTVGFSQIQASVEQLLQRAGLWDGDTPLQPQ